tara:strand:- start:9 stop:365 length:357 start_codon:yes stop_codon:yes gene_type:complete
MTKWNDFDVIWNKESPKSRQKLMQKVICRGLEPTKENCRDYWMGYIRPFNDRGTFVHCNPMKNQSIMRGMGKDKFGKTRKFNKENKNDKSRRHQSGKRPPHKLGGRNPQKKRPIQRRK